jgi:hypothetical protein
MRKIFLFATGMCLMLTLTSMTLADVTVKQRMTVGGQTIETSRQIKGSRERTEQKIGMGDPDAAAFMPQIVTITQCDLKRSVKINDRKQMYFVEPFDLSPSSPRLAADTPRNTVTRQGGTVTITYSMRDTGERKTMFGMQARRLIITNEMESSADSCSGPSKTKMEFDGWYVDFSADFNCPTERPSFEVPRNPNKPECIDRVVMKGGGSAKMGFLLEGTMKMYGADGQVQMTQTTETLELSRTPLDQALFEVPASYKPVEKLQDLYAVSMSDMANIGRSNTGRPTGQPTGAPAAAARAVAVNINFGSNTTVDRAEIEQYVRAKVAERGFTPSTGTGAYTLNVDFKQIKESAAGKVGGIFGKVTGIDTKVGKVDIDMTATLSGGSSGNVKVKSKFDGPLNDAIRASIDQALDELLDELN